MGKDPREPISIDSVPKSKDIPYEELRRHLDKLSRSEQRYRRLVDYFTDYIYSVKIDNGHVIESHHGPGCETVTGYTVVDFDADTYLWFRMIVEEDRTKVEEHARRLLNDEAWTPLEHRIVRKDGVVIWIQNTPVPLRDATGRLVGYDGLIRNVTDRVQAVAELQKSEERFRALFEGIQDAVIVHMIKSGARRAPIIEVNDATCRLLGYERSQLLNWSVYDIAASDTNVDGLAIRDRLTSGEAVTFEQVLIHRDGHRIPVEIHTKMSDFEGQPAVVAVMRDITDRKRKEELLRTQLELLAAANEKRELNEMLELCLERAIHVSGMDAGGIYIRRDPDGLSLACHRGLSDAFVTAVKEIDHDSPNYSIVQRKKPVYDSYMELNVPHDGPNRDEKIRAIAVLPLLHHEKIVGCMNVASHAHDEISTDARIALETIAALSGGIIARAETEQAFEKSEERLNRIVETSPIGIVIINRQGEIVFTNAAGERILGLSRSEVAGRTYNAPEWKITASDGEPLPDEKLPFSLVMRLGEPVVGIEHAIVRSDGERVFLSINAAPLKDEHGAIVGMVASLDDITERRRTERALRASEERFRAMFEHLASGVAVCDAVNAGEDFVVKDFNPAAQRISRVFKDEVVGRSLLCVLPHMDRFGLVGALQRVYRTGETEHLPPTYYKDGDQEGWWEILIYRLPSGEVVVIFDDVTERKLAERALRDSEARLASIFGAAPVGIGLVRDRVLLQVNERFCEMVGYSPDELIGKSARILYPSQEDYEFVGREKYRQISEHGTETVETRFLRKDGTIIDVLLSSTPLDPEDLLRGVTFTAIDITERKQMERALRQERDRTKAYLEVAGVMFVVIDREGRVSLINRRGSEILGYDTREIIGKNWFEHFIPERLREDVFTVFKQLMRGEAEPGEYFENPVLTWSGEERIVAWHNKILRDSDGAIAATISSGEDVTNRRRMEEERASMEAHLRQQQKLESIGTLAAGVAHEINNPINGIMNYAQLILNRLSEEDANSRYAARIVEESNRISEIVRNLLSFSRHEKQAHSPARPQDIIAASVSLVRALMRQERIAVEIDVPDDLPLIKCRSQQIQQVLLNLLTNARDALVARSDDILGEKRIIVIARMIEKEGRSLIRVTVDDNGEGIPAELHDRVFDPFFTTKSRDKGTGLGLSVSYGIIKEHRGALWFESEPGRGTRFHLDLPPDNGWSLEG